MKVAIFHTEFAYSGGAEKLIFAQMKFLRKKDWRVACFTAFLDQKNCFPDQIKDFEINQILPTFLNNFVPHDLMILLTTLTFPLWLFRFKDYDFFLGENQAGPWWAFIAAKLWRKPLISYQNYPTTITHPREIDQKVKRNSPSTEFIINLFKPLIIGLDKLIIRQANLAFADGKYVSRVLKKAYGRDFVNCPGGTYLGKFNQEIFNHRFSGKIIVNRRVIKKPYLLITNRHFPAKRLDYGISVLSRLLTSNSRLSINLVITGRPTRYTRELKILVKKLGLEKRVIFTSLVNEKDLEKLYRYALVYLYTAPEEDFGLGIIEAMSHGVPIVAWNKAGPSYTVKDGKTGYLAQSGDLGDFTVKVGKLAKNKKLCREMAQSAYREAKNYSWESHGKKLIRELEKIKKNLK